MRAVIVGSAGLVGSGTAFAIALSADTIHELVLIDAWKNGAAAQAIDLSQLAVTVRPFTVRRGELDEIASADVVVFAAAPPKPTGPVSRGQSLERNAALIGEYLPYLRQLPDGATLLFATNPVDPLCTWIQGQAGIPRERVLGYSTNDTARFRLAIGRALGIEPHRVEAWVLGEHGARQVPLYSRILVDDEPAVLTDEQRGQVHDEITSWFRRWQGLGTGRSSQWASGQGLAELAAAATGGPTARWPTSIVLRGEYGIDGVALGVPVQLDVQGARIEEWELPPDESAGLDEAAREVRDALNRLTPSAPATPRG